MIITDVRTWKESVTRITDEARSANHMMIKVE